MVAGTGVLYSVYEGVDDHQYHFAWLWPSCKGFDGKNWVSFGNNVVGSGDVPQWGTILRPW